MATPTSAWAKAGAPFVPSPVFATRCHRLLGSNTIGIDNRKSKTDLRAGEKLTARSPFAYKPQQEEL
ncbi:MAG: hypothetical protein ACXW32_12805 [Limisphaerales bacterium]